MESWRPLIGEIIACTELAREMMIDEVERRLFFLEFEISSNPIAF